MADFKDLEEGQTEKWMEILSSSGIELNKNFPWDYVDNSDEINEIAKEQPKKAICLLYFKSLYNLMEANPMRFIINTELNIEFNDLFNQAASFGITIPSK